MANKITFKRVLFIALLATCMLPAISAPIALIGGFIFTQLLGTPFENSGNKIASIMLKLSVIGLGFGMEICSAMEVGKDGILFTAGTITIVLTLGYFIGKSLKIPQRLSHLTASGTSICGGSAIAAVAPAVNANEHETSMALGVVFLLNSIALLIFPPLGDLLNLTEHQFGMWCAMAIHDTSSVVGAASAFGEEALMVATTVKLARALWIIPVSLISIYLFKSKGRKVSVPWFILLFVLAMVINSIFPQFSNIGETIFNVSKSSLVATLFIIGSSLSIKSIKEVGIKPLLLGVILWFVVSIISLLIIFYLL